jgi:hypothetical protein
VVNPSDSTRSIQVKSPCVIPDTLASSIGSKLASTLQYAQPLSNAEVQSSILHFETIYDLHFLLHHRSASLTITRNAYHTSSHRSQV